MQVPDLNQILIFLIFSDGHLPKEGKEIASRLVRFKMDLEFVADYSQRPLPAIAKQAVNFVFWATLIVGTLDNKKDNLDSGWQYFILVRKILS